MTTDATTLTYTKSGSLTSGETYKFRVLAINAVDSSDASPELEVIAATIPL